MKSTTSSFVVMIGIVLPLIVLAFFVVRPVVAQVAATSTDPAPVSADPVHPAAPATQLVEVQLQCPMSYTGTLYDTPSGHLESGYFLGAPAASTTGMVAAHEVGEQSWTKCYDATGKEYEFTLTPEEYAALRIRGTPQKSLMLPPAEATLAAFPAE